jgi:hypothetical protein
MSSASGSSSADSDGSSSSDSEEKVQLTGNEGESSDHDDEVPSDQKIRGQAGLVTWACPRKYPREQQDRLDLKQPIPEDFTKQGFLDKLRRSVLKNTNVKMLKGTCHDEPHKRFRRSQDKRERHKHAPFLMSDNFAHKGLAEAFYKEYGARLSFSFRLKRFGGNLRYCMEVGKKPSTDVDMEPAKFPATLDVRKELKSAAHPGETPAKEGKKRKRLSFDEVSDIVLEGIGEGPLKTGRALEAAAKKLKLEGKVELWNYVGDFKDAAAVSNAVAKVWRLSGETMHHMWRKSPDHVLESFKYADLPLAKEWLEGEHATRVLILSGDGGLGKTSMAEAMLFRLCPDGFWFVDDPDDFRELEGLLEEGQGILIDEITLQGYKPNDIKKLFDVQKTRRIKCRHFNATRPKACPMILCTNSKQRAFFQDMECANDRTGVFRRMFFQNVLQDVRSLPVQQNALAEIAPVGKQVDWKVFLEEVCEKGLLNHRFDSLVNVAMDLGVALASEAQENATPLAEAVGLKPLERKRFLHACAHVTAR